MNVQRKLGQKCLQLIKKCFPPSHPLSQVVNRNNVKLSYKCMPNMSWIISRHNRKVQNQPINPADLRCNWGWWMPSSEHSVQGHCDGPGQQGEHIQGLSEHDLQEEVPGAQAQLHPQEQ